MADDAQANGPAPSPDDRGEHPEDVAGPTINVGPTINKGSFFTVGPPLADGATPIADLGSSRDERGIDSRPWRVFVSHTSELAEHPAAGSFVEAAKRAVERAGHAVVEMATWTASGDPPAQLCIDRVLECDVYVGLLGFQYGSAVRDDPDRSYTELEFDTATHEGMPRLMFVLKEQLEMPALPASFYIDVRHSERQRLFRNGIDRSGVTRADVGSPQQLEMLLYQSLTELRSRVRRTQDARRLGTAGTTPARSAYLAQVSDIAPPKLFDRERELAELSAFCSGSETYTWWQAGPWAGKSALMSTFALHPPPNVDVICFFITARLAGQSDSNAFTEALIDQVAALLGEVPPLSASAAMRDTVRRDMMSRAAAEAQARDRSIVLLIDGVDEDRGPAGRLPSILHLLPKNPPEGLRIVLAGRTHPPVPSDVDSDHPARSCRIRSLAPSVHAQVIADSAREELHELIVEPGIGRDVVGLLAASDGGLAIDDLHSLTGELPASLWHLLEQVAGRTVRIRSHHRLSGNGDPSHRSHSYLLAHESLQQQAVSALGPPLLASYRTRINEWADTYRRQGWPPGTPRYLLVGYRRMLHANRDRGRLLDCALDRGRHDRLRAETGGDVEAFSEIRAIQDLALDAGGPDLFTFCRLAIHRRELADRNSHIPTGLPVIWALLGQPTRARALALSIADPLRAVSSLVKIAHALGAASRPSQAVDLVKQAQVMAASITDPFHAALAMVEVARGFAEAGDSDRAEAVVAAIGDSPSQVRALTEISQALVRTGSRQQARAVAEQARDIAADLADPASRALALTEVAWALATTGAAEQARAAAAAIPEHYAEVQAQTEVARGLARAGFPQEARTAADHAEALTSRIADPSRHALALASVAHLRAVTGNPVAAVAVAERARAIAVAIVESSSQARALTEVAHALAEAEAADAAEAVATSIPEPYPQIRAIALLARTLFDRGVPDRPRLLAHRARTLCAGVADAFRRSLALAEVAQVLALVGDLDAAQEVTASISDPSGQAQAVVPVARALALAGRPEKAYDLVTNLPDPVGQAQALTEVALALAEAGDRAQAATMAEHAQTAAAAMPDHYPQAQSLIEIARALSDGGDHDAARKVARRAVTIAAGILDPLRHVHILAQAADTLANAGDAPEARDTIDRAATIAEGVLDPFAQAVSLTIVSRALATSNDLSRARMVAEHARLIAGTITDPFREGLAMVDVTHALADAGDQDQALDVAERIAYPSSQAIALAVMARALATVDSREQAGVMARRARAVAELIPDPFRKGLALMEVTHALADAGDQDQALDVAERITYPSSQALALSAVARALVKTKDRSRAQSTARRAHAAAERIPDPANQAHVLTEIAQVLAETGQPDEGRRALAVAWIVGSDWWVQIRAVGCLDPEKSLALGRSLAETAADPGGDSRSRA